MRGSTPVDRKGSNFNQTINTFQKNVKDNTQAENDRLTTFMPRQTVEIQISLLVSNTFLSNARIPVYSDACPILKTHIIPLTRF